MNDEIILATCGVCGDLHEFSSYEWTRNPMSRFKCVTCGKLRFFEFAGKKSIDSETKRKGGEQTG